MNTDSDAHIIQGSDDDDLFQGGQDSILIGGLGNDTYQLWHQSAQPVELQDQGLDTIIANYWGDATLPNNVERLILASSGSISGVGNNLDNEIHAGSVGATLNGLSGNDCLYGGEGADVFEVINGEGSDTIYNFTPGFDVVSLIGFGFESFEDILSRAEEFQNDVYFDIGDNQRLTLKNISISELAGMDFGFSLLHNEPPVGYTLMEKAGTTIVQNGVYVQNNVWNPGDLVEGSDYEINSYWSDGDLTNGTTFNWRFPNTSDRYAPVRAYPNLIFGVHPYGDLENATDSTQTFPVQISDIEGLTADFSTIYSGNTGGFNVSYDIWLTAEPRGDASTLTNEIMIWTHNNSFEPWGDAIGRYTDGEYTGTFYHSGTYTALILDQDVHSGKIDVKSVFDALRNLGVVSSNEWLASINFGAEVISGVGSFTINKLDISLSTVDGLTKHISGRGTTTSQTIVTGPKREPIYSDDNIVVGYREDSKDDVGDPLIKYYGTNGDLQSIDNVKMAENGNIFTEHRDASGALLGITGLIRTNDDSIMTAHYDASHALLSWTISHIQVDGSQSTSTYNEKGELLGSMISLGSLDTVTYFGPDGKVVSKSQYEKSLAMLYPVVDSVKESIYSEDGTLVGYREVSKDGVGDPLIKNYGVDGELQSTDNVKTAENGNVFTEHRDAAGALLGITGLIRNDDGSILTAKYDQDHTLLSWSIEPAVIDNIHYLNEGVDQDVSLINGDVLLGSVAGVDELQAKSSVINASNFFQLSGAPYDICQ